MDRTAPMIVVIETDSAVCELLLDMLHDAGYAACASSATAAMEVIQRIGPALVIFDLTPHYRADCTALLCALRADAAFAALPILICSTNVDALERSIPGLAELNVEVISKPFVIETFLSRIERLRCHAPL